MRRLQYLMLKIAEECAEVAQVVSKIMQFGFENCHPETKKTNRERLYEELDDLNAIIEILNDQYYMKYIPNRERIEAKKEKIKYYYKISEDLGYVSKA